MSARTLLALSLLGVLLIAAPPARTNNDAMAAERVFGDPNVWHWAPNRSYHVVNYKLLLTFDEPKREVIGTDFVTLRPLDRHFRSFYLDCAELTIDSVSLDLAAQRLIQLHHSVKDAKLWVILDHEYDPTATLTVQITYHGIPRTGLFFVNPSLQYPAWPHEVYSQGEPSFNHFWFPCWDYPNDMATSETVTTVPDGQVVVSNGKLVSELHLHGHTTYDWKESVPHSSYLISIAVGPWKKIHDTYHAIPVDYYVANTVDDATARRSFHLTPDMIGFFSRATGLEYPYEQYAQTAVYNFPFGGQENVSATTLTDTTLHDARAEQDYPSTNLVSHELGQHWFGDYVQGHDWANIWLNEGFATYLEALYTQYREGEDAYRLAIYADQLSEQAEASSDYLRPIVNRHFTDALDMFDATTHEKGAAVLDMLRYVLNGSRSSLQTASQDETFFRALNAYLVNHRAQTTETSDLVAALRESTGQELGWFFREWVFQAGRPNYQVEAKYVPTSNSEVITVSQTQRAKGVPSVFEMPLEIAFFGAKGERRDVKVWNNQQRQVFTISLEFSPLWIDFDPYNFIDKTVQFDQPLSAVLAAAQRDPSVMSRLWAVGQIGSMKEAPAESRTSALAQALQSDSSYAVRASAAQGLGEIGTANARTALLRAMTQTDSRVRAAVVSALGSFREDHNIYDVLANALRSDDSYAVQAAAARQIGKAGGSQSFDLLQAKAEEQPDLHVLLAIMAALPETHDERAADFLLGKAQPGVALRIRLGALKALSALPAELKRARVQLLDDIVRSALTDSFFPVQLAAEQVIGHFTLAEFQSDLDALAENAPMAMQRTSAEKTLRQLRGAH